MRFLISIIAISITSSRLCFGVLLALYQGKNVSVFNRSILGKGKAPITLKIFKAGNRPLANVDLWFHYLKGNFDLVGPKPLDQSLMPSSKDIAKERFQVAPGLISPYQVRRQSGIAYVSENDVALEFAVNATPIRRLQVLIAAVLQWCMGNSQQRLIPPSAFTLFGVRIHNVSMNEAVARIMSDVSAPSMSEGKKSQGKRSRRLKSVAFVNADCVNKYVSDPSYQRSLNHFDHVFADGIGMRLAARWHQARLLDNVNGTDMFPILCQQLAKHGKRVFLYGGTQEVVTKTAAKLRAEYPEMMVVGTHDGFRRQDNPQAICELINRSGADILLVAKGAPLQERWIQDNAHRLDVKVAIGVGGLFDFYSEHVARAPQWLRELSLEWGWRLLMQPKDKAKRYLLGNPLFMIRVMRSVCTRDDFGNAIEVN